MILSVGGPRAQQAVRPEQPVIGARVKAVLTVDGLKFKDSNGNGRLDAYEDWRVGVDGRVRDLVSKMTLEDKAGMMLIDSLSPGAGGEVVPQVETYLREQKMTRFIFRSVVTARPPAAGGRRGQRGGGRGGGERGGEQRGGEQRGGGQRGAGGSPVTAGQAAAWTNKIQELAEGTRLGIPVVFKSNARNHYERSARFGINTEAGSMSEWPKEAGLAATRDMALIADFARIMGQEWQSIGLRAMYGYMADLATEPRWYRTHECFSADAGLNAAIMTTLVENLQGGPVNPRTAVALTVKHFPGGGPQELGLDPHFTFGKNQVYPAGQFGSHLKPFIAAIDAGVSSVMPYYGVPVNLTYNGVKYEAVGMAFSKQVVTDLLRSQLGFKGYVNSDTGIIADRAWGLESRTVPQRVAAAINAGVDVLSGFHDKQTVIQVVKDGLVPESRVTEAVARLLTEQFQLGLFENPYVDAAKADGIVGNERFRARAMDAQRASIVLLQNAPAGTGRVLPIPAPTAARPVKLYTMGMNTQVVSGARYGGYTVVNGDYDPARGEKRASAAGSDYAIVRVEVTIPREVTSAYRSNDPATGANPSFINPVTGKTWGAEDPANVDTLMFGSPFPWEAGSISFTAMAASKSWNVSPSLADIQAVMKEAGAARTVLCIYFRQPYVLDAESGLTQAGAILAGFGVSDSALMDVVTGKFAPKGKLPFALARTLKAVSDKPSDSPVYPAADTLFPFGHGLTFHARATK